MRTYEPIYIIHYRIHLINGEIIRTTECARDEAKSFLNRFREMDADGVLECGIEGGPHAYIPMQNILYISVYPD